MIRASIYLTAVLLLAGCGFTSTGDRIRTGVAEEGAAAYDSGLETAEFFQCRAASVGSVIRRYGKSEELAAAWRTICFGEQAPVIIPPLEE